MKKTILYTAILLIIVGIQACTTAIIEEGNSSTLPPLTRTVTYKSDVQGIMFNNCITCHGGNAPSANLDLTDYNNTRISAELMGLISRMNNVTKPMPPSGILSPELRQIMDKWIKDGLLEQ